MMVEPTEYTMRKKRIVKIFAIEFILFLAFSIGLVIAVLSVTHSWGWVIVIYGMTCVAAVVVIGLILVVRRG
jgi:NADH:ubiquinone oxidoreductase subunit K